MAIDQKKMRPEDVPVEGYPKGPRVENTQSYIGHPYYDPAIIKKRHDALFARSPLIKQREIAVSGGPMEIEAEYGQIVRLVRIVGAFPMNIEPTQVRDSELRKNVQNRYYRLGWVLNENDPKCIEIRRFVNPNGKKDPFKWWIFLRLVKSKFKSDRLDPYLHVKPKQLKDMVNEGHMKKGKIGSSQDFTMIG